MAYCIAPFDIFEVSPTGNVYCCCADWLPTSLGNIFEESAQEIWNGEIAQDVRRSVLDGSFRHCTRCPYLPWPHTAEHEDPSLVLDRIPTLRLCYDRTCNLACRSCRLEHVASDRSEVARVHDAVMQSGAMGMARRVFLTGSGDPIASPTYYQFLRELPRAAPHLEVALLTNGLLLDARHLDELGPTLDMITEVGISVDAATPETYAKNRGGDFARLWQNVDIINARLRQPGKRFNLYMCYVLQANNFRELPSFAEVAFGRQVQWINVYYLRNWAVFTEAEYLERAAHLPGHPDHAEVGRVLASLSGDGRMNLPLFPAREF